MPGRHSAPQTASSSTGLLKYVVIAVVAIVVIVGGVFAAQKALGSGCADTSTYTLAADPAIAEVVTQVVADVPAEDLGCASIEVTATDSGEAYVRRAHWSILRASRWQRRPRSSRRGPTRCRSSIPG